MITLSPDHVYAVKGKGKPPSVTSIIDAQCFCTDPYYLDRGKAVHKMVELYRKHDLDEESVGNLQPYLDALKKFDREAGDLKGIFDYKTGQKAKWHALQLAAYYELWFNGLDESGKPLRLTRTGYEVIGYRPNYDYCGMIDGINLNESGAVRTYNLYLRDDATYKLEEVENIHKVVRDFLQLASAYHVRKGYKI
jgi:hypothetical protein